MNSLEDNLERLTELKEKTLSRARDWLAKSTNSTLPQVNWDPMAVVYYNQMLSSDTFDLYYRHHPSHHLVHYKSSLINEIISHAGTLVSMILIKIDSLIAQINDVVRNAEISQEQKRAVSSEIDSFFIAIYKSDDILDRAYFRINHVPHFFKAKFNQLFHCYHEAMDDKGLHLCVDLSKYLAN